MSLRRRRSSPREFDMSGLAYSQPSGMATSAREGSVLFLRLRRYIDETSVGGARRPWSPVVLDVRSSRLRYSQPPAKAGPSAQ